jgi:plasmid stabilization system protein ParE
MKIEIAQEAHTEITAAIRWYARKAGKMQVRAFRAEVRKMLSLISEHPSMGSHAACGTRRMVLRRFPFSIVYYHSSDILRVIALAHHSRRPVYWAERR